MKKKQIWGLLMAAILMVSSLNVTDIRAETWEPAETWESETESETETENETETETENEIETETENCDEVGEMAETEEFSEMIVCLQERITALPSPEEYDYLTRTEKKEVLKETKELKHIYYDTLNEEERAGVDASHLFALDLYAKTYAFYSTEEEYAGQLTLEDVNTKSLGAGGLSGLQQEIDALPDLAEVADVSSIAVTGEEAARDLPAREQVLSYADDPDTARFSDEEVDELYPELYDTACTYYQLEPEQATEIRENDLAELVSYFSVGVARYSTLSDGGIGQIDGYSMQRYTGKLAKSSMKFGYYRVNTKTSDGSRLAFCMDSTLYSPGREGTTLVTETECTSKKILTILYYGYGGPGELVKHDLNGYCETHMAICHAVDGKSVNKALASAAYKKLYTNVPDKTVYEKVRAFMVESATAGRQTLIYPIYEEDPVPEEPVPEGPSYGNMQLILQKKDADSGRAEASGTASLEGAIFALEYHSIAEKTEVESDTEKTEKLVWYFRTDEEGKIDIEDDTCRIESYTFSGDPGRTITSAPLPIDAEGEPAWPLGEYRIREISPPALYRLEGIIYPEGASADEAVSVTEGITWTLTGDEEKALIIEAQDLVYRGEISLTKSSGSGRPLAGASYRLTDIDSSMEYETKTTGADGSVSWDGLAPGAYVLTEVQAPAGYELLSESVVIEVPCRMTPSEAEAAGAVKEQAAYDEATGRYCFYQVHYDISDARSFEIPMAGGGGTLGLRLLIPSALLLLLGLSLLQRKRSACYNM